MACWIHLGRRIASNPESLHSRPTRVEGNLDQHASGLLSAGAHDFLDSTQVLWPKPVAVPHAQCAHACRLGGIALARVAATQRARRVVGSGPLGIAPSHSAIGRVGNGIKKYSVLPVLSFVDLMFFEDGCERNGRSRALVAPWLGAPVLCIGDHEQTFHGNAARRACALRLVAERANSMARYREPYSVRSDFGTRKRLDDLGTEVPFGCERRGVGANMAGPAHHCGSRDLVLSRQTPLASSTHFHLPAMGY